MEKKTNHQTTFFTQELIIDKLNQKNNPLKKLNQHINWDIFKNILQTAFNKDKKDNRGRPHYNYGASLKNNYLSSFFGLKLSIFSLKSFLEGFLSMLFLLSDRYE